MKRKNSRYRGIALSRSFVSPSTESQPTLAPTSCGDETQSSRRKRIFIVREVQLLPAADTTSRKMQRILVFDNHPETLRLIFGGRADADADFSEPQPTSLSEFVIATALTVVAVMGMFWPLFIGK